MSREQRQKGIWPANRYSRYLWLIGGLWEDVDALFEAYENVKGDHIRTALARHLLVDLDSLDELVGEFKSYIKKEEAQKLQADDRRRLDEAFTNYHRVLEPRRQTLRKIRNFLGAHRTGMPWKKARKSGITDPDVWGQWEQFLVELEGHCDLFQWVPEFNAVVTLFDILKDFNLDQWYEFREKGTFTFFSPSSCRQSSGLKGECLAINSSGFM